MKLLRKIRERGVKIDGIIKDLEMLRSVKERAINKYAVEENILFFKAVKSVFTYIWWLLSRAPKIDSNKLLEINDFGVEKWDKEMHTKLIEIEKKNFPGLINLLINKMFSFIKEGNKKQLIISLGAGGMEVERQVITHLIENKYKHQVIFVGVDRSETAQEVAQENMADLTNNKSVVVKRIDYIDKKILNKELNNLKDKQYLIIICRNNIFELDKNFATNYFDIVFHTFFKHHLGKEESKKIDIITQKIAKYTIEYDGYRSFLHRIPQTLSAWSSPIFLNASIFSNLRFAKKHIIRENNNDSQYKLSFYSLGYYLKEYKW